MEHFTEIKKKDNISYEEFIEDHVKKSIPVVFKNATSAWKSNNIFTPGYFRENYGDHKTISGGKEYTMNEVLAITEKSTVENPAPYPILFEIPVQLSGLLELMEPLHMNYAQPNWFNSKFFPYGKFGKNIQLFIGGKGNQYSLHKDYFHTNAWITQLYGDKKFIVFPGDQEEFLYVGNQGFERFLSPINTQKPDYNKFPKYKHATPLEIIVHPGETIFIPSNLWHTTYAPGHNISLIFDQLNGYNYKAWKKDMFDMKKDENKMKALATYFYALSAGSWCKSLEMVGNKF